MLIFNFMVADPLLHAFASSYSGNKWLFTLLKNLKGQILDFEFYFNRFCLRLAIGKNLRNYTIKFSSEDGLSAICV